MPTDEERRVFKECNDESFWYRSVPFAAINMAITQALVTKGVLSTSPRWGSLPKLAFAGLFGYIAGKLSYMKICQDKFKRLVNSPLGEALRHRAAGLPPPVLKSPQSEMSDPDKQSFEAMFTPAEPIQRSYNTDPPSRMGRPEDLSVPVESNLEDVENRRKGILYEDLRLKNRENYEVTLTQKAETLLKSPEKEVQASKKEVKNIYGDTWDE